MLNSSSLEPKFSPAHRDRYEPLRSLSTKIGSHSSGPMAGSRSFSEHLSGLGLGIINRPMAAISKRFNSTTLATKIDASDSDEAMEEEPLHIK